MKLVCAASLLFIGLALSLRGQEPGKQARQLENQGDPMAARLLLQRAVRNSPGNLAGLSAYAEFLDEHNDPETRPAYERLIESLDGSPNNSRRAAAARRLVVLDLLEGDRDAAAKHLHVYRAAGGKDWDGRIVTAQPALAAETEPAIEIPGPLRSFARMAALSPDVAPADLLPALARNVVTNGYQATSGAEGLEPTEYMKLLIRYVSQARELTALAGPQKVIRVEACDSPQTGELLRILGYRMRGSCGGEVVLETVNASRAFLTIDSGFPLAQLEQALRTNRPYSYDYRPAKAPVLHGASYWLSAKEKQAGEFVDAFLADPALCRLYLGLSKLDRETADALRNAVTMQRLRPFAHVLDFFGAMFEIRNGAAVVPGGPRGVQAWADLAGVSPRQGAAFFERLISKDDGWMASYFDALARIEGPVQDYLTEPARLKRFYLAIRGRVTSPGPARPVFRSNTDLLLLTARLRLEPDGRPHIPGNLEIWRNLFINHPHGKYDGKLTRSAAGWKEPDDVLEALFGLCRKAVENEPLKIFMALSDLNRHRDKPLAPATVDRLARGYRQWSAQYTLFSECPSLSDATILKYLDTIQSIDKIGDQPLRADAAGSMQALAGLWQIFCREGALPESRADRALAGLLTGFEGVHRQRDLFDSARAGVRLLLEAANTPARSKPQDRMMELLAGTDHPSDVETSQLLQQEMIRIFEAQKLVPLDALFDLADNLESVSRGEKLDAALMNRLVARIADLQLPRASLSGIEKNSLSFGYWTERHLDAQRKFNPRAAIDRAGNDAEKLKDLRGLLAPLLRDTLVGLNYVHYAPPGAQILLANPLFVRSHDFLGMQGTPQTWKHTDVLGTGWPTSAGGRLVGSLASLPYALAEAEQNFLVPAREQALIWGDLAPQLILSAKIPRWWNVTAPQMHWVGLHMRYGESLLAEAALDSARRRRVSQILRRQASPARERNVARLLEQGDAPGALASVTPAELFALASGWLALDSGTNDFLALEIRRLARQDPERVNYRAISRAFGTPKPTLTNSYRPELLYLRTFPTLMGYSSRIMAESWESTILYWAAVADEVHLPPSRLNLLIPEWTQKTLERIFATHLEDWPALLRSLRLVGNDIRLKLRMGMETEQKASLE